MDSGSTIETERLYLRPVSGGDLEGLYSIFTDPEIRRYLLDGAIVSRDWVEDEIRGSRKRFVSLGVGIWGLFPKETGYLAGFCGFRFFHDPPELELLYGVVPSRQSRGLATEAARAAIRYAFEALCFEEEVASTDAPNTASIRAMEKLSMRFDKRITVSGHNTVYYKLKRKDFRPGDALYRLHT